MSSARQLLADAAAQLAAAGVDTPRVDAELLLAHVLGVTRTRLATLDEVAPDAATSYASLIEQRAARIPLQHLTGAAPFRHLDVPVGPGVFIPRPETELLVDVVLRHLASGGLAVDLCSGSGALALAIAHETPARVVAVEADDRALQWLRRNAAGSGVEVVAGDVRDEALLPDVRGLADAVVCNPPYVPAPIQVAPEVRHDPAVAVFAGADGLALIPHVIARAAELLRAGGILAMEHDETHQPAVLALLVEDGRWREVRGRDDLAGRPRYVSATRRP